MTGRRSDPRRVEIGARLRLARVEAGLTQTELGHRLGVSYQQVNKYEAGQNTLSCVGLWDAAVGLGVPIVWLLGEDPTDMPALPRDANLAKLRARLVTAFAMLGDDRLRHVALHAVVALAEVANKKAGIGTVGEVERLQERTGAR